MPRYLRKKPLLNHIGDLSGNQLDALVTAGMVRTVKFGPNRQSPRLYSVQDVEEALGRMAEGRHPIRRRKRA